MIDLYVSSFNPFFAWRGALLSVKADTLIRWHRKGFRLFWRWKSKPTGRSPLPRDLRQLIRQVAAENVTWGEERFADELKLNFEIQTQPSKAFGIAVTVAHYPTGASKESDRAPAVLRDLQKSGRRTPRQLRQVAQVDSHNQYQNRLGRHRLSDRKEYTTRLRRDPQLISSLCLIRGKVLPRWNYAIALNL
jgi:hypothetical protein